ncbi:HAD family hydrolase [Chondromyces apiculatus]|uniref:Phosphoserine phosphatase n=1 Tax=Chondromyces apiculatus DSM 436 TaxID=1192034 RepID=A0A017TC39_9BACT|nr:HAD family hydrolase [Chondromyces apiculatus]EYF06853.1 Phosphoserine phosphatase [Chondromyces apiculatus DSM 436]
MTATSPPPAAGATRRRAALFDMDRTLIRRETASLYVRYQRDRGEASLMDLVRTLYWVGQYTLGLLDAERMGERALLTLRGTPEARLIARCDDWFPRYVEQHISPEGRAAVRRHQEAGDVCAIVTAATSYTTLPLARLLDIPLVVSTVLEVDAQGHFTGRPVRPLCYGEGKVTRARALAEAQGFRLEDATFYSDSISDLPLLSRVGEPVAVNPDPRLRREAERRGWRILRW